MKEDRKKEPLILSLETATDIGSIALYEGGHMLGQLDIRKARTHAKLLTPMAESLMNLLEIPMGDLDAVCVSKGPGSYTGLRVGVSSAKGLCMALDIPPDFSR